MPEQKLKHTPGPWSVCSCGAVIAEAKYATEDDKSTGHFAADTDERVVYDGGLLIAESVKPHNRRLIAAAPDLLAALKELRATASLYADKPFNGDAALRLAFEQADDALATAETQTEVKPDPADALAKSVNEVIQGLSGSAPGKRVDISLTEEQWFRLKANLKAYREGK